MTELTRTGLDEYCRLTCSAGSERGLCKCLAPADCGMRDQRDFADQVRYRTRSLVRFFWHGVPPATPVAPPVQGGE